MARNENNESNNKSYKAIKKIDLPLHCPQDEESVWNSHPRVYLSIIDKPNKKIICPYCGTLYELID